jgi:hypothetical protein
MRRVCLAALALALLRAPAAEAHPGAAPWEADGRPGRDTCHTCHFDSEPVRGSDDLQLLGLPRQPEPGKVYDLIVVLKQAGMKAAGFLIVLDPAAAGSAPFKAGSNRVEAKDAAIRSTPAGVKQADEAKWPLQWRAPDKLPAEIVFYLSANAGNDDQSPLGDRIYLKTITVLTGARKEQ